MIQSVIDSIQNLKHYTYSTLKELQKAKIPSLYDLKAERCEKYLFNGYEYIQNNTNTLLYLVKNIPFLPDRRKEINDSLSNVVKLQEIVPFIIFLNGRFIRWSDIKLISDQNDTYIMISNTRNEEVYPKVDCIVFPYNMTYKEEAIENGDIMFNVDGQFVNNIDGPHCTSITLVSKGTTYSENGVVSLDKFTKTNVDTKYELLPSNLMIFKNGLLDTTCNVIYKGLSIFDIANKEEGSTYKYQIFLNKDGNHSKTNIHAIRNIAKAQEEIMNSTSVGQQLSKLTKSFDFNYDKNTTYEDNLYNALDYIMGYNSALLNDVYQKASKIESKIYTGKKINSLKDSNGYVTMSRKIGKKVNNYVMIFINGLLYNYYSELQYSNKNFKFPAIGINDTDVAEFIFFKDVWNNISDVYLYSSNENCTYNIDSGINAEDIRFFSEDSKTREFNINSSNDVQFEVDCSVKRIESDVLEIKPKNSFYYDRTVKLVSTRQFRYMSKRLTEDIISIKLPKHFNYCNKRNKYMVFVDGRRINNDNIMITIPGTTRPFDDISIYLTIPQLKGSKIEIFYLPDDFEITQFTPVISDNGFIIIDKSKLDYNFSRDLYIVFINGKKVPKDDIVDIGSNKVKLIVDQKSLLNVTVIKHVKNIDILTDLFDTKNSIYDSAFNLISSTDIAKLFDSDTPSVLTSTEDNIADGDIDKKKVLYEIIRKYYLRPSIYKDSKEMFPYDFEGTELFEDTDGTMIINYLDANLADKINMNGGE